MGGTTPFQRPHRDASTFLTERQRSAMCISADGRQASRQAGLPDRHLALAGCISAIRP
jgi:hypothetical protein